MKRFTQSEWGYAFVEVLAVIAILGIIATISIPAFAAQSEKDALPPLVEVIQEVKGVDAAMVVSAAELAYMSANSKKDSYTLQELVDRGYLNADLTDAQAITMAVRSADGSFVYKSN